MTPTLGAGLAELRTEIAHMETRLVRWIVGTAAVAVAVMRFLDSVVGMQPPPIRIRGSRVRCIERDGRGGTAPPTRMPAVNPA